jgi:hypothetical protein
MPSTITLTSANIAPDGLNSSLVYNFPNSVRFADHSIAVAKISMYYAWTNINATPLGNNTFQYQLVVGALPAQPVVTVTIPDGVYEVSQLNEFLQFTFINAGFYLINASGQNVYYAEFIVNPTLYAIQINTYPVPTALPVGFTQPANWVGYPAVTYNPSIVLPANINKFLGFAVNFTTPINSGVGTVLSFTSSTAPQVQPNPTLYLSASNIQNIYASPSSIIYSVTPTVSVGEQIVDAPNEYAFSKLLEGTYSDIRLRFLGTDLNQIALLDPTMTITLLIRDNKLEGFSGDLGQKQYSLK